MNKQQQIEFKVIDNNTGKEADIGEIALKEDWAKGLMYCDMEGFAILDDGNLVLLDECGKYEYCPSERFSVKFEDSVVLSREEYEKGIIERESMRNQIAELFNDRGQASKETAEKIFKMLISKLESNQFLSGKRIIMEVDVENLAKQFDVEIEEL